MSREVEAVVVAEDTVRFCPGHHCHLLSNTHEMLRTI
jgi:hypothetical protein